MHSITSKTRRTTGTVAAVQKAASTAPSEGICHDVDNVTSSPGPRSVISPRTFIPSLFYAMGSHVPKIILEYAQSRRARWSELGEFEEVAPQDVGLHKDLVDLLSDATKLTQDIEELVLRSILYIEGSPNRPQTYICHDEPAQNEYYCNRAYWTDRAFEMCCYVFPRDQILESS